MVYFTNQWKFPEMTFNRNTCNELYPLTRPQKKCIPARSPYCGYKKLTFKKKIDLSYIIALMIDLVVTC